MSSVLAPSLENQHHPHPVRGTLVSPLEVRNKAERQARQAAREGFYQPLERFRRFSARKTPLPSSQLLGTVSTESNAKRQKMEAMAPQRLQTGLALCNERFVKWRRKRFRLRQLVVRCCDVDPLPARVET